MGKGDERKRELVVDATKCQCCLVCVMRCGLRFAKAVNPSAAKVTVKPFYGMWPEISFSDGCDQCGICARYCPSGAISIAGDPAGEKDEAVNAS